MSETVPEILFLLYESSKKLLAKCSFAKKTIQSPKTKPAFLGKKQYEPIFKIISKKFPNLEAYNNSSVNSELMKISPEIKESCEIFYNTFVDLMNFKDQFLSVSNQYTANNPRIDMISHSHICIYYLEILSALAICMNLISSIEDRKLIAVSYGLAYEKILRYQDPNFIKVCDMIYDYDQPFKRLMDEVFGCQKIVEDSLIFIIDDFRTCSMEGKQMQNTFFFNLSGLPQMIAVPLNSHIPELQYCGYNCFFKWIYYCTLIFPSLINNPPIFSILNQLLSSNLVISLYRDEVLLVHKELTTILENHKSYSKKAKDIGESYHIAFNAFIQFHKDRREYFLSALQEVNLLVQDQPGILGPKLLHILQILVFANDEIRSWLAHYNSADLLKLKKGGIELFDLNILPLMFEVYVLKNNIIRYIQVIQRYFVHFLTDHDVRALEEMIKCEEKYDKNDVLKLKNIKDVISRLDISKSSEINESSIPLSIRLDCIRLEYRNTLGSQNPYANKQQTSHLNNIHYHCLAIDSIPSILQGICCTYDICCYGAPLDQLLKESLSQCKYLRYCSISCLIYSETSPLVSNLCADEIESVADNGLVAVDTNLDIIARYAMNLFMEFWRCYRESMKNGTVSAASISWLYKYLESHKEVAKKMQLPPLDTAGSETRTTLKEDLTDITMTFLNLQEICLSLSSYRAVKIADRIFFLRQSILPYLEAFIKGELMSFLKKTESIDKYTMGDIQRPSIVLSSIKSLLNAVSVLSSLLDLNLNNIFYLSLISLSMPSELLNSPSITSAYSTWFTTVFLVKDFTQGDILYCNTRHSFIVKSTSPFRADEYTDTCEMRSLAELIGPYGIRYICINIDHMIAMELENIKKFMGNAQVILAGFDSLAQNSAPFDDLFKKVKGIEETISSFTSIGAMFATKTLLRDGLKYAVEKKSPLIVYATKFWQSKIDVKEIVSKVCISLGFEQECVDYDLVDKLYVHQSCREVDKDIWLRLFVYLVPLFVSYMAIKGNPDYLPPIEAFPNNLHLIIYAFNKIMPLIFIRYRVEETSQCIEKMEELLKYLSLIVIRINQGTLATSLIKNREIYFILFELLARNNQFINTAMVEKYVPVCLITSAINKVLKNKSLLITRKKNKP